MALESGKFIEPDGLPSDEQPLKSSRFGDSNTQFRIGYADYSDLATQTTELQVLANTYTDIPNDGQGSYTTEIPLPEGITTLWDATAGEFNWANAGLSLYDIVEIRVSLEVTTTTANQDVEIDLFAGVGSASEYQIVFHRGSYKASGTHQIDRYNMVYMGGSVTLDYPSVFRIISDGVCYVKVHGWVVKVTPLGLTTT